ncbi:MAG TPA: glycoside hydrolase family 31 protein [Verrucomicrobiae bacterium]|nr:glycoside hydrolase family 31 protein [Verrucomicrobiae bacterium]
MKSSLILLLACSLATGSAAANSAPATNASRVVVSAQTKTSWWGGVIEHGYRMPLAEGYEADLCGDTYGNQGQPLLLSSRGDVVWSEDPFSFQLSSRGMVVEGRGGQLIQARAGNSLRDAYLYASRNHFPPSGKMPDELLFSAPQYNTWIELMYDQNQADILKYSQGILDNDFPPGVLMIDDNWQQNYGQWDFRKNKFPDAKGMIRTLHAKGFKVMLWVCPFVHTNSHSYADLAANNLLLKGSTGGVALVKWWNGESALLDFTNPQAVAWFRSQLDYLQTAYKVDGFKFDGGDSSYYQGTVASQPVSANTHSELFGRIGLAYPLNEYRAMWKMGGQPLAERLRDKDHSWSDLPKLVPNMLLEGLMGYPFCCPDMIGGGEYKSFQSSATIDQELVVRSAQCHALMPMMQFSVAPWRVLDPTHLKAARKAVEVREKHKSFILELARQSASTGEPIVRSLEYAFPHQGYEGIKDQFLLGDRILVAPVLEKGARERQVVLPPGVWQGLDGKRHEGPARITVPVQLDELCFFERTD